MTRNYPYAIVFAIVAGIFCAQADTADLRHAAWIKAPSNPLLVSRYKDNPDKIADRLIERRFAPIGELEAVTPINSSGHKRYGTGFLISPCYILTAAHVAYGNDMVPHADRDESMIFRAGPSTTAAFAGHTTATHVTSGNTDTVGKNDWALLRLGNCIGRHPEFGWLEPANETDEQLIGRNVAVLGFPADRERGQLSIGYGRVMGRDLVTEMLKFSASLAEGQSGGPVLSTMAGRIVLVGMALRHHEDGTEYGGNFQTYRDSNANEFLNISSILQRKDVKSLIEADKANFGKENPAAAYLVGPL